MTGVIPWEPSTLVFEAEALIGIYWSASSQEPSASVFPVLGLQVQTTMPSTFFRFILFYM